VIGCDDGLSQPVIGQLHVLYRAWCDLKIYFKVILTGFPFSSLGAAKSDCFPTYFPYLKMYVYVIQQRGLIRYPLDSRQVAYMIGS
jgi:hypothetical protein